MGHVGRLSILVAIIFYFAEADKRKTQAKDQRIAKHLQAWQVINAAQGQRTSYGRIQALQSLSRDHASIVGLDLSDTYIPGLKLENAMLHYSTFHRAGLYASSFSGADLSHADFTGAILQYADLTGAIFQYAKLTDAFLVEANLQDIVEWDKIKSIEYANIYNVKNPPDGFIEWALEHGAVIIENVEDWKKLISEKRQEQTK